MNGHDQASALRNIVKQNNVVNIKNAKIITITSGKGGVGKSNTAVNLAVWFRKMGKRVIIFDADFGLANVEIMFATPPKYSLKDVVYGSKRIRDIINVGPYDIGFISGGSGIVDLNDLRHDQVEAIIGDLASLNSLCDVLIVDTGAGVGRNVMDFVVASPEVILVSTPEPSSLTDSYSLVKALYKDQRFVPEGTNLHLLANKVDSKDEADAIYEKLNSVVGQFLSGKIDYLGMIPRDEALERAVRRQEIISLAQPVSKSARAYGQVASSLINDTTGNRYMWGISAFFKTFMAR